MRKGQKKDSTPAKPAGMGHPKVFSELRRGHPPGIEEKSKRMRERNRSKSLEAEEESKARPPKPKMGTGTSVVWPERHG